MTCRLKAKALLALGLTLAVFAPSAAAQARAVFTVPEYALLSSKSPTAGGFVAGGIAKECDKVTLKGILHGEETESESIELEPGYERCRAKALDGLAVKFVFGRCNFRVHGLAPIGGEERWKALMDIVCPPQYSFEWNVYEAERRFSEGHAACSTDMPPQADLPGVEVVNLRNSGELAIHWRLKNIAYRAYGLELLCGSPFGALEHGASLSGSATLVATNYRKRHLDFAVRDGR